MYLFMYVCVRAFVALYSACRLRCVFRPSWLTISCFVVLHKRSKTSLSIWLTWSLPTNDSRPPHLNALGLYLRVVGCMYAARGAIQRTEVSASEINGWWILFCEFDMVS